MVELPSIRVMRKAFAEKDAAYDGTFFVAVKTTGIFCRPVCRARPPREENVTFFKNAKAALRAGFRACKLCRPLEIGRPPPLVQRLIGLSEQSTGRVSERDLLAIGIEPTTARRQFKAHFQTTFSAWQRARKIGQAVSQLKKGKNMPTAQLIAGFESTSGFREALSKMFPDNDSRGEAVLLYAARIASPLGPILTIAGDAGIVALDFIDKRGFQMTTQRIQRKLNAGSARHAIVPGEHKYLATLESQLAEYFAGNRREFTVPLEPRGTDFERRAWDYLRTIPYAETRSYGQQARAIGNAAASRAVGAANGRNDISILIPCHRVIGSSGSLVGYGGGLERKKWLLNHERENVGA